MGFVFIKIADRPSDAAQASLLSVFTEFAWYTSLVVRQSFEVDFLYLSAYKIDKGAERMEQSQKYWSQLIWTVPID